LTDFRWIKNCEIAKNKGGLLYPSKDVIEDCLISESLLKRLAAQSGGKTDSPKFNKK
jgi:hypothetical protein